MSVVLLVACGGPQIPTHNGYKPKETKPWLKAKVLKLDAKNEAKADGDVAYADMRRARWYQLNLPTAGQLSVALEITPPGDAVNDDFDLGFEVLDPANRVISKSDLEDEDAHELTKKKTLVDLIPGRYLIHIYLQGRLDTADYVLRAQFKTTAAAEYKSDYPAQVAFVPPLPMVPIEDDTPRNYRPPVAQKPTTTTNRGHKPPPAPPPPVVATVSARIISISVVSKGTLITLARGTTTGASNGMKGKIAGISVSFTIDNCNERTCTAVIAATPDQIKNSSGTATLSP
ncbi:MAG TPA: hypothetical protein VFP84_37345 [Kofleriaceae bacterium]|nr:hypothetical protein [Kofleriaceae bacterium]